MTDSSILAISSLLQPPIVRSGLLPHTTGSSGHKVPTSKDIPPVTLTNIPHIEGNAFQSYLAQAGSLYEAFRQTKEADPRGTIFTRQNRSLSKGEEQTTLPSRLRHGSTSSISSKQASHAPEISLDVPQTPKAEAKTRTKRVPQVSPLSTIPKVYFEEDFHLENPRTFDIVSERAEIVRQSEQSNGHIGTLGPTGRKALATNAILQEKLSWYMDTVEVHLISSISSASTSFFAALGSLKELHSEAAESVAKIKSFREDLASLDKGMALGGLRIIKMRRRQENVQKLNSAVYQLRRIVETVSKCEEQIEENQIEQALNILRDAELLIIGQQPDSQTDKKDHQALIDLSGIKALEGAEEDLSVLKRRIGKGFEARLLDALLDDLRQHIDNVSPVTTFQRWTQALSRGRTMHARTPSVYPAYLHISDKLRTDLQASIEGLSQSECVMNAMSVWRDTVLREFKSLIRRHLPNSSDDDVESTMSASTTGGRHMSQQEKSSILARNLRTLDPEDSEEMTRKIYANVGEALRRVATQVKVLLDLTSGLKKIQGTPNIMSPKSPPAVGMTSYLDGSSNPSIGRPSILTEEIHQALDMSNILGQAVDIAQTQVTKILKVRSEQTTRLPLFLFLRYFQLNRMFADECEAISGRGGSALKNVVNAQIKDFVAQFGEIQRRDLIESMDADKWEAKDFTEIDSETLTRIIDSSTQDVNVWQQKSSLTPVYNPPPPQPQPNGHIVPTPASKPQVRSASIDTQKYILPASAIKILHALELFSILTTGIPSLVTDIATSLLEYFKLFNSRSAQLILGAGATLSAGLKNITTKHLALANQALSFIAALMPHVREFIRRYAANATGLVNLMTEFDKVKRLYGEHQSSILDKLVEIMSGRATTHINAMKKVQWDDESQGTGVNTYMETLVKETTTLHKVLSKHLPEGTVRMVMQPVFASYKEQWTAAFSATELQTEAGQER